MTICTIDVHARDVVAKLISQKASALLCSESGIYFQGGFKKFIVFQKSQSWEVVWGALGLIGSGVVANGLPN
jgi:hypothetical protein